MKKRYLRRICMMLFTLFLVSCLTACGGNLRFASGDKDGEYYKVANTFAGFLKSDKQISAEVMETTGSAGNLRLLAGGYVQMAVVQSDVAAKAYAAAADSEKGYSAVGGLYTEVCHIIVKADSDIWSVADLTGKKISIGAQESGTESNAKELLLAYGITEDNANLQNLSYSNASAALIYGEIDALFTTGNMGMSVIQTLSQQTDIRLIPVTANDLDQMNQTGDIYHISIIPAGTYNGQTEDIPAISVSSMIIVSDSVDSNTVKKITETLYNRRAEFAQTSYLSSDQAPEFIVSNIPIPFHKGAEEFYQEIGLR